MSECNPACGFRRAAITALAAAREETDALRPPAKCTHRLGSLPCTNDQPHRGEGHGCVHIGSSHPDSRTNQDGRQSA